MFGNQNYFNLLRDIKDKIRSAQIKAAVSVNKELLNLYWEIGRSIVQEQNKSKWGDSVIKLLADDLKREFPDLKGFSRTNLFNIRKWYLFYSILDEKVQQLVGQLPWGHNIVIISKIKEQKEAVFYVRETIENNWSRNVLIHQIESQLYKRKGKITTNFELTLPKPQSDLAKETLKDPYIFDFLAINQKAQEREIENELVKHITKFLIELGSGFAYVGNQYLVEVSGKSYYIDLLFYHLKLKCYVVIELKTGDFKPEYAGKINFYLSVIDNHVKDLKDKPSIGIILCKTKNKVIAEYALRDLAKPIGVSEYKLVKSIPENLAPSLPTVEQIETELFKGEKK